jgi:uroporphyrinogen decarboxylase
MTKRRELTGRERVRLALRHQAADRVPIALVCSGINPPARRDLEAFLLHERGLTVDRYLKPLLDIVDVAPPYRGPALPERTDAWGVLRRPVSYGSGAYDEIERHPLAGAATAADLASHRWPDPDWWDYDGLRDRIARARADGDPCLMIANGNLFETSWYMRGFEQMLVDAMVEEEMFDALMTRVTDFYVEFFSRALAAADGEIDLVFTADDIGDQRGPILQPQKWRRLIVPHHRRLNGAIHGFGAKVIYHTDGSVMWALDGLVEMGIDVLQALQFSADGMDPVTMKRGWGSLLCFEGGVSVQTTLPFGTVDEVRAEVRDRIAVLGAGGGYILGPSHWIQAGTPPANIAAMFDEAAAHRPAYPAPRGAAR